MSLLLLALLSCAEPDEDSGAAGPCDRSPPLTWDSFGQQFMHTHCAGCHSSLLPEELREGATLGVDFDTYAGVLAWADRIRARSLGEAPTMPPGGGPEIAELDRLEEWLGCQVAQDLERLAEGEGGDR